jgi:septum formation protein
MRLILASNSLRRAEILRNAGIVFETAAALVDETPRRGEAAVALVKRLALEKARAAGRKLRDECMVIGADTEVVLDGRIFGKPSTVADATEMLRSLSGKAHDVVTGIAVLRLPRGELGIEHEETRVTFASMTEEDIAAYVASGEPFDKAGGYAIQGLGGVFITRVEGCYFNVMGLPLARLYRMLREIGAELRT